MAPNVTGVPFTHSDHRVIVLVRRLLFFFQARRDESSIEKRRPRRPPWWESSRKVRRKRGRTRQHQEVQLFRFRIQRGLCLFLEALYPSFFVGFLGSISSDPDNTDMKATPSHGWHTGLPATRNRPMAHRCWSGLGTHRFVAARTGHWSESTRGG